MNRIISAHEIDSGFTIFKSMCGFHAPRALKNAPFHLSTLHLLMEHDGTTNDTVLNPEKAPFLEAPQPSRNPCTKDTAERYEFVLKKCIQIKEKFDGSNVTFKVLKLLATRYNGNAPRVMVLG